MEMVAVEARTRGPLQAREGPGPVQGQRGLLQIRLLEEVASCVIAAVGEDPGQASGRKMSRAAKM
jgi:hypothetical protein